MLSRISQLCGTKTSNRNLLLKCSSFSPCSSSRMLAVKDSFNVLSSSSVARVFNSGSLLFFSSDKAGLPSPSSSTSVRSNSDKLSDIESDEDLLSPKSVSNPSESSTHATTSGKRARPAWQETYVSRRLSQTSDVSLNKSTNSSSKTPLVTIDPETGESITVPPMPILSNPDLYQHVVSSNDNQSLDDDFFEASLASSSSRMNELPELGITVDYCIFCYHGTSILRHDNTKLLSKLVSERGQILPKRFTKCCSKHQRKVATVIKRARWLNYIPWQSKLHPKLRFTSMKPALPAEGDGSANPPEFNTATKDEIQRMNPAMRSPVDQALADIKVMTEGSQ
jgi:small subunit ribosomal protein S18